MNYEAFGRAKNEAPTIVLSAGLGGLGGFWQPQFAVLAERFHVIAYDHRGTGANNSALPDGYAISAMADDVVGILDKAGVERCHFMGHALGGLIGMELGAPRPVAGLGSYPGQFMADRVLPHPPVFCRTACLARTIRRRSLRSGPADLSLSGGLAYAA